MNRHQLTIALKEKSNISTVEAKEIIKVFFDSMKDTLKNNNRVEIRGLWNFYIKNYKGYNGRNPKNGNKVSVKQKKLPVFRCGKDLEEQINNYL